MAYLGKSPQLGSYIKLDDISSSFDGSETTFSLTSGGKPFYTSNPYTLLLVLGGVIQEPILSYTINQDEITFASPPVANSQYYAVVLGNTFNTGGLRSLPVVMQDTTTTKNIPITQSSIQVLLQNGDYVPVKIDAA